MTQEPTSFVPALSRIFWMMIGPALLVLLALSIIRTGEGWLTSADIGFLAVLGGLVLARWLEFRGGQPQTATGEPATAGHLRRYAITALLVGLGIWIVANLLANHWLTS